jgi:hypothetical protein
VGGPVEVVLDLTAKVAQGSPLLRALHGVAARAGRLLQGRSRRMARSFPLAYALVAIKPDLR